MEVVVILMFGLPIVLWLLDKGSKRPCRTCGTDVKRDARVCPACGANPRTKWTSPNPTSERHFR